MDEKLVFRRARPADAARIMEIIRQAQAQMRALGSLQWQDGYPAAADIGHDIACGYGWVFEKPEAEKAGEAGGRGETEPAKAAAAQGNVIAYGAVVFDGEPAYDAIEGAWLTDGEYVVLHRMAVADGEKGRGVATEFMRRVEAMACGRGTGSMRVDTNFDNRYMLRMLGRLGFVYCGKVRYRSGERLAFEKTLGT